MLEQIFWFLIFLVITLTPIVLIVADIVFVIKRKKHPLFELFAFLVGTVYMIFAFWIWDLPSYEYSLNVFGFANAHEPVNVTYMGAILLFAVWGFLSYFILKFCKKKCSPIMEVFLLAGVYVGVALSIVWLIQFLGGAHPPVRDLVFYGELGEPHSEIVEFHLNGTDYFVILCECIVPIIYIVHCIRLMVSIVKEKAKKQEQIVYDNKVLNMVNGFVYRGANLFWLAVVALLPVLGFLTMILVLFGQQPDSIILAFTKTSDWVLSGELSPPPVAYDTHYLCTVSLRGHEKLVKPTRYGIRRGEKIVVNRQLCVANAFEQLIQERTPGFHRRLRNFYDTYGYPISRHINTAWSADVVYLLMKPLEWIFVFVLYLFDEKPENRINSQYLPKIYT